MQTSKAAEACTRFINIIWGVVLQVAAQNSRHASEINSEGKMDWKSKQHRQSIDAVTFFYQLQFLNDWINYIQSFSKNKSYTY